MNPLSVGQQAPDLTMSDPALGTLKRSDLQKSQNLLLVFNLGFA